ncbi:MAG: hypothetical protein EOO88_59300 [Pedobacter sp.]|nr:MAG: hypothetical protein EOO88_59300 [Pedobacter sp.]
MEFNQWFDTWSQKAGLAGLTLPSNFYQPPAGLETMSVLSKTSLSHADGAFIIQLETGWRSRFKSGDLLAIYPANDHRERLYSIGRIDKEIQLSVKLHPDGLGSGFLYNLEPGTRLRARIVSNSHFHFPKKASAVVMICNGTGIAPFLGMTDENNKKVDCHLYCGFRTAESFELYKPALKKHLDRQQLNGLHTAYSREGEKQYVKDLLARDAGFIAETLSNNGVLMLCGSLSMQKDVIELLDRICEQKTGKGISHFQSHGQVLMDCY